ncbi:MAG: hypothetical protein RLZZ524_1016, partial [Pseudomonadota bacterium]
MSAMTPTANPPATPTRSRIRTRTAFPFLIGVDGGGTGTRARLCDAQGRVLGDGAAGPSALGQGVEQAWRHIGQAVEAAFGAAG